MDKNGKRSFISTPANIGCVYMQKGGNMTGVRLKYNSITVNIIYI